MFHSGTYEKGKIMRKKVWFLMLGTMGFVVGFALGENGSSTNTIPSSKKENPNIAISIHTSIHSGDTNRVVKKPSFLQQIKDSKDGNIDFSKYIGSAHGFLPVPIIVTEPAVGFGGGVAFLFLHDSIKNRIEREKEKSSDGKLRHIPPPSVSGVAGFGTENESWGAGAFHLGIWREDTIRYLGAAGYASINYDFYGLGERVPVNVSGIFLLQQITSRLGKSNFFLGANYSLIQAKAKRSHSFGLLPPPAEEGREVTSGGLSPILEYDSRDNIFTPNKGYNAKLEWSYYDNWLGSDNQFSLLTVNNRVWFPIAETLVLGVRLDGNFSGGDVPFYMLPFIHLRGIPAMRYQGRHLLTSELELRWDVTPRWSLVGFAGAGWTSRDDISDLTESDTHPAGGFGFRYLIARIFNLRTGIDFGFSEEEQSIYFITGSAWAW